MRNLLILGAVLAIAPLASCNKPAGNSPANTVQTSPGLVRPADEPAPATAPGPPPPSPAPGPPPLTADDFVTRTGASDLFEIAEAKLVQSMSHRAPVKAFAAMMIADHTRSTARLNAAIARSGLPLAPPTALPTALQEQVDALKSATPVTFDQTYLAQQTAAHKDALRVMTAYAARGDDPGLERFATDAAGMIRKHLDAVIALDARTP